MLRLYFGEAGHRLTGGRRRRSPAERASPRQVVPLAAFVRNLIKREMAYVSKLAIARNLVVVRRSVIHGTC